MNRALLEYEMKLAGKTVVDMANLLGIDRTTFYKKCSGISEFKQSEIRIIVETLHIDNPMPIFFDERVS